MTGELKAERCIGAIASAQWNRIGGCFKIDKMYRKPDGPQTLCIFFYPYQRRRFLFCPQNLQQTTLLNGYNRTANLAQILKDRKSTRLNSSHVAISYAVFC